MCPRLIHCLRSLQYLHRSSNIRNIFRLQSSAVKAKFKCFSDAFIALNASHLYAVSTFTDHVLLLVTIQHGFPFLAAEECVPNARLDVHIKVSKSLMRSPPRRSVSVHRLSSSLYISIQNRRRHASLLTSSTHSPCVPQ